MRPSPCYSQSEVVEREREREGEGEHCSSCISVPELYTFEKLHNCQIHRSFYGFPVLWLTGLVPHSGVPNSGVSDSGVPDFGVPDSGVPDSGVPDFGVPDSGVPDSGVLDSGVLDSEVIPYLTSQISKKNDHRYKAVGKPLA